MHLGITSLRLTLLALTASQLSAQTTINYDPGETDTATYETTQADPYSLGVASGSATQSGVVSGDGSITKTGAGTLALTGSNTYSGGTTVNAGTLTVTSDANLGAGSGPLAVTSGATLNAGTNFQTNRTVTLDGSGTTLTTNNGELVIGSAGTGSLALTNGADASAYNLTLGFNGGSGSVDIDSGSTITVNNFTSLSFGSTLNLNTGGTLTTAALSGSGTLNLAGGTLRSNAAFSSNLPATLTNASTIDTNGFTTHLSGLLAGDGALTKSGSGILTLSADNTYSGGTTVSAGTLQLGAGGATGSVSGNITNNATVVFNRSDDYTFNSVISGTGSVVHDGYILRLLNPQTYTGPTFVKSGAYLVLSTTADQGLSASTTVDLEANSFLDISNRPQTVAGLSGGGAVYSFPAAGGTGGHLTVDVAADQTSAFSGTLGSDHPNFAFTKSGAGTQILSGSNTYTGGTTVSGGTLVGNTLSLQGNITNNATLTFDQATAGSYGGLISGTGSLTKTGEGILTVTGANTYSGGTTVSAGTLLGNTTSLQGDIANNATLTFDQATAGSYGGVISGTGSLTKTGADILTITGANTYSGGTTVSAGTLLGNTVSLQGDITNNAALVLDQASNGTYDGVISGDGSLTKSGTGNITLSGSNIFTGGTTISGGTLTGNTASLQGNMLNNAAVVFDQTSTGDYTGNMSGTGSLTKTGFGNLTLSGTNTFTGDTTISAGTLEYATREAFYNGTTRANPAVLSGATASFHVGNSGYFSSSDIGDILGDDNFRNGSTIGLNTNNAGGNFTLSTNIVDGDSGDNAIALHKLGSGNLTLSGTNTYSGGTTISAGTLLGNSVSLQGDIANNTAVVFDQATNGEYTGNMSGAGSLTKTGTGNLTLSGNNTSTGGTTISAGNLIIGSDARLGTAPVTATAGHLTLDGGTLQTTSTFSLDANRGVALGTSAGTFEVGDATTLTILGTTSGTGTLIKTGTGALTLAQGSSGTSPLSVAAGTLNIGTGGTASLGATSITNNATTVFNHSSDLTLPSLTGSGDFTKTGSGSLTVASMDTSGSMAITEGELIYEVSDFDPDPIRDTVATITGNTATFTQNGYSITVGDYATGSLTISEGGTLALPGTIFARLNIGRYAGSQGTATVQGNGSSIATTGRLSIGRYGTGTLNLQDGATATFNSTYESIVGHWSTGIGTVNLSGTNSALTIGSRLVIGLVGTGTLNIGTGSTVTADRLQLAESYQVLPSSEILLSTGTLNLNPGGTLIVSDANGTALSSGLGTATFNWAGGTLKSNGTHSLTATSDATLANGTNSTFDTNGQAGTYSGVISGQGALTKTGTGSLSVTGANTYTGGTTVSAGTLLGNTVSLQGDIANNATLTFNQATAGSYGGVISGTGSLTKTGEGILTVTGANTYTGGTTVSAGTLLGNTTSLQGSIANNATLTFDQATAGSYGGLISGTGSLTKTGFGNLTLSGNNTFTGGTTISAGTLEYATREAFYNGTTRANPAVLSGATASFHVGNSGYFSSSDIGDILGDDNFRNGSTIGLNTTNAGGTFTLSTNLVDGDSGDNTIALHKLGSGNLTLSGSNTYSGSTTLSAGTLTLGSTTALSGTSNVDIASGTTLDLNDNSTSIADLDGAGNIALGSATLTTGDASNHLLSGIISGTGSLTKSGAGSLTLSAANTYSGDTTINAGTLKLGNSLALQSSTLTTATGLDFDNLTSATLGGLSGSQNLALTNTDTVPASVNLTVGENNSSTTYSGILSGGGSFTKTGTGNLTLSGANAYSGGTTVSAGTLTGNTASLQGNMLNNAAVVFDQTSTGDYTGNISGTGSFTKTGTGTLTLSGNNLYSGDTTISGGTLKLTNQSETLANTTDVTVSGGGILDLDLSNFAEHVGDVNLLNGTITGTGQLFADAYNVQSGTISAIINGNSSSVGLTKTTAGTLTITNDANYNGATTIEAGTVEVTGSDALIRNTSAMTIGNTDAAALTLTDGGSANVTSTLTLGNTDTGTGTLNVSAPALAFFDVYAAGDVIIGNEGTGNVALSGGGSLASGTDIRLATGSQGSATVTVAGNDGDSGEASTLGALGALNIAEGAGSTAIVTVSDKGQALFDGGVVIGSGVNSQGTLTITGAESLLASANYNGTAPLTVALATDTGSTGNLNILNGAEAILTDSGTADALSQGTGTANVMIDSAKLSTTTGGTLTSSVAIATSGSNTFNTEDGAIALSGVISGNGAITKTGTGALTLSAANTYSGDTTINAGTLKLGNSLALQSSTLTTATGLDFDNLTSATFGGLSGSHNLALTNTDTVPASVNLTVGGNNSSTTYSGILSGGGSFTKTGSGNLTLSGTNTYTGGTAVSAGTLTGNTASIKGNILNNAAVVFDQASTSDYTGTMSGTGSLTKTGAGVLTLSGTNTFSGNTTVSGGSVNLANTNALQQSTLTTTNAVSFGSLTNATLGGISGNQDLVLANASSTPVALTVGSNNSSTAHSGIISGGGTLTKTGLGTLTLSGANTFTSSTTINNGAIAIASDSGLGATPSTSTYNQLALNGGKLVATTSLSLDANRGIYIESGGGTLEATYPANLTINGEISGNGHLGIDGEGNVTLARSNAFSGRTTLLDADGTLTLGHENALQNSTLATTGGLRFGGLTNANVGAIEGSESLLLENASSSAVALSLGGASATTTHSGVISGSGSIEVTGGSLTLSGANTFTGITTVSGGSLTLGNSLALQGSTYVATGNSLSYSGISTATFGGLAGSGDLFLPTTSLTIGANGEDTTFSGRIYDSAVIIKTGNGNFTLDSSSSGTNRFRVDAGTFTLGDQYSLERSEMELNGGTLSFGSLTSAYIGELSGSGNLTLENASTTPAAVALRFENGNTFTYDGVLSGAGSLNISDSSDLTLSAANTFTGDTAVSSGTLALTATGSLTGDLTLNNGTLSLANPNGLQDSTVYTNGGQISYNGISTAVFGGLAGSGDLYLPTTSLTIGSNGEDTTFSGRIYDDALVIKTGNGNFTFNSSSGNSNRFRVDAGTFTLGDQYSLERSEMELNGGELSFGSLTSAYIGELSGSGNLTLENADTTPAAVALRFQNGNTFTYDGVLSGTGSLNISNSSDLTLSAANTFTGDTTVSSGTLRLTSTGSLTGDLALDSGDLSLANSNGLQNSTVNINSGSIFYDGISTATFGGLAGSSELDLPSTSLTIGSNGEDTTFSGILSGSGSLTKSGTGTLTVSGDNIYFGGTEISEGSIQLANTSGSAFGSGDVTIQSGATLTGTGSFTGALIAQAGSTLAPGNSPGLMTVGSGTTLNGTLNLEIGGTTRGTEYDAIDVTGDGVITLGGILNITLIDGYTPTLGDEYGFFNAQTIIGSSASVNLPTLTDIYWDTSQLYTDGILGLTAVPEPSACALIIGMVALIYANRRRSNKS